MRNVQFQLGQRSMAVIFTRGGPRSIPHQCEILDCGGKIGDGRLGELATVEVAARIIAVYFDRAFVDAPGVVQEVEVHV